MLLTQPDATCLHCKESRNAAASIQAICSITDIKGIFNGKCLPNKSVYIEFEPVLLDSGTKCQ